MLSPRKKGYKHTWPDKVKDLPRTLDRFRAANVFFDVKYPSFLIGSIDARKWTSWASLSALASILEVLEYDLEDLGLLQQWKQSDELKDIRSNKTLAILKELRNYEMHFEYENRQSHLDIRKNDVKEPIDHDSFFFSAIDWDKFKKLRYIHSGKSIIDQEAVKEFNEYSKSYCVETIIYNSLEYLANKIYSFCNRHKTKAHDVNHYLPN